MNQVQNLIDDLILRLNDDLHHIGVTSAFTEACLKEFFGRISQYFPVIHEGEK